MDIKAALLTATFICGIACTSGVCAQEPPKATNNLQQAKILASGSVSAVPSIQGAKFDTSWISRVVYNHGDGFTISFSGKSRGAVGCTAMTTEKIEGTSLTAFLLDRGDDLLVRWLVDPFSSDAKGSTLSAGNLGQPPSHAIDFFLVCTKP